MRLSVFTAVISLSFVGMSAAVEVEAAIKRYTNIPPQSLGQALRNLAKERDFQIVYASQEVSWRHTEGAVGELTAAEVLEKLLSGSGLGYRYLDEKTVTIFPLAGEVGGREDGAASRAVPAPRAEQMQGAAKSATDATEVEKPSLWDRFRMAQVDQGSAHRNDAVTSSVEQALQPEEVVVTAQKRSERLQDVPVPVTAISADALATGSQVQLQDYYARVPALSLTTGDHVGSATIAIRGLITGINQTPTVGVIVDDVPYTSSTNWGYGNVVTEVDPSDLARVEVLRGPQGTLYGASSMGGLLKYVTVDPSSDKLTGRVQAGVTSVKNADEVGYNIRGTVNVPLSDSWAMRASGFSRLDAGYIDDPVHGVDGVNRGRVSGGRLSAFGRLSDALTVKLATYLQNSTADGTAWIFVGPGFGDLQQSSPQNSGGHDKQLQVYQANVDARLGSWDLTSVTAYTNNKSLYEWDFTGQLGGLAPRAGGTGVISAQDVHTHKFTQELRLAGPISDRVDWLLGAFYNDESTPYNFQTVHAVDFMTGVVTGELAHLRYPNAFQEHAVFTDVTFKVSERFDVQVGGRQSRSKSTFAQSAGGPVFSPGPDDVFQPKVESTDSAFTYLLTPRFRVSSDLMFYGRAASGYRPGGPNEGGALNPNLPAEYGADKTQNYEIGVKGSAFARRLSFDASVYYIDWKDIQINLQDPASGLTYFVNTSRAKSQGVELSIDSRPLDGLNISAWVAWNEAELTEDFPAITAGAAGTAGDRLPFSSRLSGNVAIDQDFPLTDGVIGFAGLSLSYVGDRKGSFLPAGAVRETYPGYAKTDVRAGARLDSWTFSLFVNNLADRRGVLQGGAGTINPNGFYFIQPRTYGLTLDKSF